MKKNLIESCGADWVNKRVAGAYFVSDGKLLLFRRAGDNDVVCENREDKVAVNLKPSAVKGFGLFAYPKLGYRRDEKTGTAGFFHKKHTYERGLRPAHITVATTPGYLAIGREFPEMRADDLMKIAFLPKFDTAADVPAMLAADRFSVVLSADVMVEPSVMDDGDDFTVYYRKRPAGHINVAGKVSWRTKEYAELLHPLFKNVLKVK